MKKIWRCALLVVVLACALGCAADEDDDQDIDQPADDDSADDDVSEPLYAAARCVAITPNAQNHPEQIYLGGLYPPRQCSGVHDDLEACALVLEQGGVQTVLVSLDLLGFTVSRIREIKETLSAAGMQGERVLIASTHTHEAPDTLGVFGASMLVNGVSPSYMAFLQQTIVDLVLQTRAELVPVHMRAARVAVREPASNYPGLVADLRLPEVSVGWLSAASFEDQSGRTVASLVNWHCHPEVMIQSTEVSADFPSWLRERMRARLGGNSVYISGALGGLSTPTGVDVPARGPDGEPLLDGQGDPVLLREGSWDKARSLGYVIADKAADALETAQPIDAPILQIKVDELLLPVTNPIMWLAFKLHILEFDEQDLVDDQPGLCGPFGCTSERMGLVRLGPLALITAPGESFPETFIGRPESAIDYGAPWGVKVFPAIEGLVSYMAADVPMHMAICGNEIGYLIPENDFLPKGHPDYYEEDLFLGRDSETRVRAAALKLLIEMPAR